MLLQKAVPRLSRGLSRGIATLTTVQRGRIGEKSFRMFFNNDKGETVSPWHDLPLLDAVDEFRRPQGLHKTPQQIELETVDFSLEPNVVNCVVEMPRDSYAKFEISLEEKFNPILHDTKNGELRYIDPPGYNGVIGNYGSLPQTFSSAAVSDKLSGYRGDSDPIDFIEIGGPRRNVGEIFPARVIGALPLLDESEIDWKVIVVAVGYAGTANVHDLKSCNAAFEYTSNTVRNFFGTYKCKANPKAINLSGPLLDASDAMAMLREYHSTWKCLGRAECPPEVPQPLKPMDVYDPFSRPVNRPPINRPSISWSEEAANIWLSSNQ